MNFGLRCPGTKDTYRPLYVQACVCYNSNDITIQYYSNLWFSVITITEHSGSDQWGCSSHSPHHKVLKHSVWTLPWSLFAMGHPVRANASDNYYYYPSTTIRWRFWGQVFYFTIYCMSSYIYCLFFFIFVCCYELVCSFILCFFFYVKLVFFSKLSHHQNPILAQT